MKTRRLRFTLPIFLVSTSFAVAQSLPFSIEAYRQFLQQHQVVSAAELRGMYPAGYFLANTNTALGGIAYFDSIDSHYQLTNYEKQLLQQHNFAVTERLKYESFAKAFDDVYKKDLPVFVSTDAILHAIHMSYDRILKEVEYTFLMAKLNALLSSLHAQVPALASRYANVPAMRTSLKDLDVYLTVPRKLLGNSVAPYFSDNIPVVDTLLQLVYAEHGYVEYPLFSSANRLIDFSQFRPRGHYIGPTVPIEFSWYFRAMMWLGRMEIYLIAPITADPPVPHADVQRQVIDAALVAEAAQLANVYPLLQEMDDIIRFFVGESDNVTLPNVRSLLQMTQIDSASQLLDVQRFAALQDTLRRQSYAFQLIMSQLLRGDPMSADSITPASSFLLLGQRFVIDSYVTGSVVYDRIKYQNVRVKRMLPATMDILFALGNSATAQLLQEGINQYHYGQNLAALRYLIDSYGNEFWNGTLYNSWLNAIRTLNPPAVRDSLPMFMRTAAWWQEKINTQQATWAQLRHDNLLYAKQSYTGIPICSFPESYVEPVPQFYDAIKTFATLGAQRFQQPPFNNQWIAAYFNGVRSTVDTLGEISRKELSNTPLTNEERSFLQRMLHKVQFGCTPDSSFDGWYAKMFYADLGGEGGIKEVDLVVADVHTAPADENGGIVGWILHGGTGPLNMGVWIANKPGGGAHAYVGPVLSYYEHVSTNFHRLTDEEWRTAYNLPPTFRPSYVNLYLADSTGNSRGAGINLLTGIDDGKKTAKVYPAAPVLYRNYPNPFNPSTFISFTIPPAFDNAHVELAIFDIQGRRVKVLVDESVPAGNFVARWDGRNEKGSEVASGAYFYQLSTNNFIQTMKLLLLR
ncbi:MAG: DUF3160 domain-containing protein [Bacteroidetes bacterium]|nr:DUF3160 domain-containing protein [Bacteroidota bacterium]MCW5894393.1 DUF3160 domain-containing protein [Bacteroidota bacterium]